mmetsp:Transcript_16356/g.30982  ORF Transcript_16356/g.30982 Transcript_16356/m.30982 type:complete len:608 (+) Transcript_16356:1796-3619(+)
MIHYHKQSHYSKESLATHGTITTSVLAASVGPELHKQTKEDDTINLMDNLQHRQRFLREYISPHAAGWAPSEFPNPLSSPAQCHIDSVVGESSSYTQQGTESGSGSTSSVSTMPKPPRLLFCDPDGIFSEEGVIQISQALRNFTSRYAHGYQHQEVSPPCRYNRKPMRRLNEIQWNNTIHGDDNMERNNGEDIIPLNMDMDENNRILRGGTAWKKIEKRDTLSMVGTSFQFESNQSMIRPEIAVAIVSKMDLADILHEFTFYTFEDEEDMINDAAQYFASYLHNAWFGRDTLNEEDSGGSGSNAGLGDGCSCDRDYYVQSEANGILIFISVADRVCFVSSGSAVASVLPWWRLERIVTDMKDDMRNGDYFHAISSAIENTELLLDEGPPTVSEKTADFLQRFGVILLFSSITFFMAICGEYRDRKKRYEEAEVMSVMDGVERDKARILQREFKTDSCPICLESFQNIRDSSSGFERAMKRVDSYGIPVKGNDGNDLKILRCGHVFDYTCWRCWITSNSCGDPGICPVCRADITKKQRGRGGETVVRDVPPNINNDMEIGADGYGTFQNERGRPALDESVSFIQSDERDEELRDEELQRFINSSSLIL